MNGLRTVLAAVVIWLFPVFADAAQSFIYFAQRTCPTPAGCSVDAVLAFDAVTGRLAARIALPPGRDVRDMQASRDGRIYLSLVTAAGAEIGVIDATRHQFVATHPVPVIGRLAVSRDGLTYSSPPSGASTS